jgi:uncharacterized protein (DUF1778 family)
VHSTVRLVFIHDAIDAAHPAIARGVREAFRQHFAANLAGVPIEEHDEAWNSSAATGAGNYQSERRCIKRGRGVSKPIARQGCRTYNGRTHRGGLMPTTETRRRSRRLELRTTPDERDLIDRAVASAGSDLTDFVVGNAVEAARRVLADRDRFELDDRALAEWEAINARRARDLPGLRRLMERPSPFAE